MPQFYENRKDPEDDEYDDGGDGEEEEDDDDEVDDGGEPSAKQDMSPSKLFARAQNALWKISEIETPEGVNRFFREFGEVLDWKGDAGTLLHKVVEVVKSPTAKAANMEILVKRLLNTYPKLLKDEDEKGQSALYLAILEKQWKLVEYMLQGCLDKSVVARALANPCRDGEKKTCLHIAFERDLRARITKMLIDNADDTALEATDAANKTPLHYAVRYSQCGDDRTDVIARFIQRDQKAIAKLRKDNLQRPIKTFLDSMVERSVYLEHQHTAKLYLDLLKSKAKAGDPAEGRKRSEKGDVGDPSGKQGSTAITNPKDRGRQVDPKHQGKFGPEFVGESARDVAQPREVNPKKALDGETEGKKQSANRPKFRDAGKRIIQEHDSESNEIQQKEGQVAQPAAGGDANTETPPNTSIKRSSTSRMDGIGDPKKKVVKKKSEKPSPQTLARNSERILHELKLHYLRTRKTESAISFLYGKNPEDRQVCFDYDLLPLQIKGETFKKTFGKGQGDRLKFDEVLQFVSFPQVTVQLGGRQAKENPPGRRGRRDMKFFFDWLYAKGVRHIIKVSVDDTGSTAHSEEAIKECLEKITVEHLDWQKADLDPSIICGVGSKAIQEATAIDGAAGARPVLNPLRELTLRWSGNNVILRAWSEPEGLSTLPMLEKIHLHIPAETYDSETWISARVEEFKTRLNRNIDAHRASTLVLPGKKPSNSAPSQADDESTIETASDSPVKTHVEVFKILEGNNEERKVATKERGAAPGPAASQDITSHQWLKCTDRFAAHLKKFWDDTRDKYVESRGTGSGLEKDVIVALIDDGVDPFDPSIDGHVLDGASFNYTHGRQQPYFVSEKGHGTVMASMIKRVCPMAKIYPIRLQSIDNPEGKSQIVVKSVISALQAAIDKGASIISMSWTVPVPAESDPERTDFTDVLQQAYNRNITMFCSSPDHGQFTDKDYPTAHRREKFFRIGAARDDGTIFSFAGPKGDLDFIFPGVEVVQALGSTSQYVLPEKARTLQSSTGSSVATALAAGLAATIIYCVKAGALCLATSSDGSGASGNDNLRIINPIEVQKLAEQAGIKAAFSRLGAITNNKFIQVWDSFDPLSDVFEDSGKSDRDRAKIMIDMALKLLK
ncbi:hypothetical protein GQ53DRAFT_754609 [Thozetella sp. PMI_491]|nr:hypothetical protein GQ53DRAFT_754609 [Thozetella sp. PMI_491]